MINKPYFSFENNKKKWEPVFLGNVLKINSGRDYKHLNVGDIPVYGTGGYMLSVDQSLSKENAIGIGRKGTIDRPQLLYAPFWTVDTLFFMTPQKNNDLYFLYTYMQKINWKSYDESSGVPSLSKLNIEKIDMFVPDGEEQIQIGSFFKDLDDLISLHQEELDALKKTKQGFLQKMFPKDEETLPTIRFNSFVETWKQDEFGKVIKLVGGATPLKGNKEYWIGDIVWLSSQEIKNKYVSKGTYTISEKAVRDNRTKVVPLSTPLIVTRSGILAKRFPISISLNEVAINQDIKALIFDKTKIDPEFIVAQIKAKESYILNNIVKTGTTVQSVNLPDLNRMILHIPEYEEQVKIGEFFRQLDEVVDLKEQELEALKQTKQGFLQKMFV